MADKTPSYRKVLDQISHEVQEKFQNNGDWVHGIEHVKSVVGYGRQILDLDGERLALKAGMEREKLDFLVELCCWLHDLGRTKEMRQTVWGSKFNHAVESEISARKMLGDYREDFEDLEVTMDDLELCFTAIAEHNQPTPKHKNNLIVRVLQDADRGEGFGYQGMISVLQYNKIIRLASRPKEAEYKEEFLKFWPGLVNNPLKRTKAIHWLTYISNWYGGGFALSSTKLGGFGKDKVCPLYTDAARKIYKKRYLIVKKYLQKLKKAEENELGSD